MLAVINVDAYPFLALSDLICHLADTLMVFFDYTVPPDSEETELRSSNQEVSPSADKNTRVVLVSYCACSVSLQLFLVMWTFSSLWVSFVTTDVKKLLQGLVPHELTAYLSDFDLFLIQ